MPHSNVQTFFLEVTAKNGKVFVVGTPTQRGFTRAGVAAAFDDAQQRLPLHWSVRIIEVFPLSSLL